MATSPKRVRIDLIKEASKGRTSPKKTNPAESLQLHKQFSFSDDLQPSSSSPSTHPAHSTPIAKKLFNPSPSKLNSVRSSKPKGGSPSREVDKIRQKYRNFNRNYEKIDEEDRFFKRSIEKLKSSFFRKDGDGREMTKKILKEIGRYAENRSKQKERKEDRRKEVALPKGSNFPVELYGFRSEQEKEKIIKTKTERQMLEKGTFLQFEKAYELTISQNNKQLKDIDYTSQRVKYYTSAERQTNGELPLSRFYDSSVKDEEEIGQRQINIICQIFQCCSKYDQPDTIDQQDLSQLIDQFRRRYFIMSTQQTPRSSSLPSQTVFNNILNDFKQNLKVIFYRKQTHDIYDCLYYLRQTNHLSLVCQDFPTLKQILRL